jgi:hypothetical protein
VSDPQRRSIDERVRAWMRDGWEEDDERFGALALEIFGFQFEHCLPYRRFCQAREARPDSLGDWREIPAVPAGAFKEVALRSFPSERTRKTFRTSGTSGARRGELHLDTLDLYEASLLPPIRRFLFPELAEGQRCRILVMASSPDEAPDSSLSHMFGCMLAELGTPDSGFSLQPVGLLQAAQEPIALCGTALACAHLLDSISPLQLPRGSRVMETGGFKGRRREIDRHTLYASIEEKLGVPAARIVNQYGMTELGSQFYDSVLREPDRARRKLAPPWARVRLVDPHSGREALPGEPGIITIHDLANTGSIAAIQTADLGRANRDGGFEVLGRQPGAEERGCSIAADLMLGA